MVAEVIESIMARGARFAITIIVVFVIFWVFLKIIKRRRNKSQDPAFANSEKSFDTHEFRAESLAEKSETVEVENENRMISLHASEERFANTMLKEIFAQEKALFAIRNRIYQAKKQGFNSEDPQHKGLSLKLSIVRYLQMILRYYNIEIRQADNEKNLVAKERRLSKISLRHEKAEKRAEKIEIKEEQKESKKLKKALETVGNSEKPLFKKAIEAQNKIIQLIKEEKSLEDLEIKFENAEINYERQEKEHINKFIDSAKKSRKEASTFYSLVLSPAATAQQIVSEYRRSVKYFADSTIKLSEFYRAMLYQMTNELNKLERRLMLLRTRAQIQTNIILRDKFIEKAEEMAHHKDAAQEKAVARIKESKLRYRTVRLAEQTKRQLELIRKENQTMNELYLRAYKNSEKIKSLML